MSKRATTRARVPKKVIADRKKVAQQWGYSTIGMGFTIKDKLLFGEYKVKKVKKKGGKTRFIVEFDNF